MFPRGNKVHQDLNDTFGENAKLLEEHLKVIDWKFFAKLYAVVLPVFLVTLFAIIVVVKLALIIV